MTEGHKAATSVLFLLFGVAGLVFGGHALWQKWVLGVRRAHVPDVFHVWHAHNDVLQAWFVWGLPGLALLLMAYGLPLVWFIRRRHTTPRMRGMARKARGRVKDER